MSQKIEDLQTRLQITLQSQSELEKKHQEAISQINSQRLSEIVHMKTNFSKKENQQNEIISNLKEKIKSLKTEISNYSTKLIDIEKKSILEKEQTKEQQPIVPFSIQIPSNEIELKWKKRYKTEKEKKKKLKELNFQQKELIDKKQYEIESLEKELIEKQKIIENFQLKQNETSTIIQSLQQKVEDFQSQNSFSYQDNQKKYREQSNNNMEIELASFLSEQNEIHNKKVNSLSLKLSKAIQINNELNEKNEKLAFLNHQLKEKIKDIDVLQNDLNNSLFENQEKDRIIKKIFRKIQTLQSKNKALKKENFEYKQNQSFSYFNQNLPHQNQNLPHQNFPHQNQNLSHQNFLNNSFSHQNFNSSENDNNSQIIDKFFSIIDSHKSELNNIIQSSSQQIPVKLLRPELMSDLSESELKIDRIIEWYNNTLKSLENDSKQLKIMKNVISSCFTNIQFNFKNNKIFCEQARNAINSLKDKLREMTLKHQQMHLSTLDISENANS